MENLEKLTNLFVEVFNVDASLLLEPEDIMACTSFAKAKEILRKNDVEI